MNYWRRVLNIPPRIKSQWIATCRPSWDANKITVTRAEPGWVEYKGSNNNRSRNTLTLRQFYDEFRYVGMQPLYEQVEDRLEGK